MVDVVDQGGGFRHPRAGVRRLPRLLLSAAVFILIYVFSGFEAVLVNSGEIRQPQRVIPFALIVALSASVALFLLIQIVCIGTLPNLAVSERPLAEASLSFLGTAGPPI